MEGYLRQWVGNLENFLVGYIMDEHRNPVPPRLFLNKLQNYVFQFLENKMEDKIILFVGMRGVGKTTMLSQLYFLERYIQNDSNINLARNLRNKIYITTDHLSYNNYSLKDFLEFYEKYLGVSLERLNEKTILLIDEIQYDKKWGIFLKLLFDRTKRHKNLLVIATGSSALLLQSNPDIARRTIIEKVYALDFTEYIRIKYGVSVASDFKNTLLEIIFHSKTAKDVYHLLRAKEQIVFDYWSKIPQEPIEIDNFFTIGSFPFTINTENKVHAREKILSVIDKIIEKDILEINKFDSTTIAKINNILYLLSFSDQVNLNKMSSSLSMNINTLRRILDTLTKTEVTFRLPSFGRSYSQARKQLKYLFSSPSIRESILKGVVPEYIIGKKLEDYSAMIFNEKIIRKGDADLFYDSSEGGADFIIQFKENKKIVIETGFNKDNIDQITLTSKKVKPNYGILAGGKKLEIVDDFIVKIPLYYWLLI